MKNRIIGISALLLAILMLFCGCRKTGETEKTTAKVTEKEVTTADAAEKATEADTTVDNTTHTDTTEQTTPPAGKTGVTGITLDKYEVNLTVGTSDMPMVTMTPETAENKSEIWESSDTSVATVNKYGNITGVKEGKCTVTVTSADNKSVKATVNVTVKAAAQVTGATYIQGILIVNKTYALPSDYNPGIVGTAQSALDEMTAAAAKEGISLWVASGFRSYDRQSTLYNNYVARDGKAEADRYSARPGHSEHQTGLAFDLNSVEQSFGETREGKWLSANCWKYGFIIRYPKNKETQTGYMYEPWHVRYLGKDIAKKVFDSGLCLEEYLGITSVYSN